MIEVQATPVGFKPGGRNGGKGPVWVDYLEGQARGPELDAEKDRSEKAVVEFFPEGSFVQIGVMPSWQPHEKGTGGKRGCVRQFSRKARQRLLCFLAMLNRHVRPLFVTVTLPQWLEAVPDDARTWIKSLFKRWQRNNPNVSMLWKLEPQKNGSPHLHCFVWGLAFMPWQHLSVQWAEVVHGVSLGSPPVFRGKKGAIAFRDWIRGATKACPHVADTLNAATRVEAIRSSRGVQFYASKYIAKEVGGEMWSKPGRFWGVMGKNKLPRSRRVEIVTTRRAARIVKRIMRRYLRARGVRAGIRRVFSEQCLIWARVLTWAETGDWPKSEALRKLP